jgi:phage shock protein C
MTDGSDRRRDSAGDRTRPAGASGELQQAVDRFEQAVQDLVGSATSEFSDRATSFLNETTAKLERELGGDDRSGSDQPSDAAARMAARRRARARARSERVLERSPRLERDDENAKIVGVCAGIANYYGVEAWVVRCIAVTGLLFFGSIVFPAYWIMYFVMDDPRTPEKARKRTRRSRRKSRQAESDYEGEKSDMSTRRQNRESVSPRRNLRNVQADLQEVELRLRRMETHVTSGQYELQRELHKIESEEPPASRPASA